MSGSPMQQRMRRRIVWAAVILSLYPASYALARGTGQLVHYHYGLYACVEAGREHDGTYHVIRSRAFGHHHPTDGHVPIASIADDVFAPLASLELRLRGLPVFERAW